MIEKNQYRSLFQLKYLILTVFLVMALFGSLQIGLLDPICLLVRSFAVALMPGFDLAMPIPALDSKPGATEARVFIGAWFVGLFLFALVAANLWIPRFFCRVLCPLGAFLGALSRSNGVRTVFTEDTRTAAMTTTTNRRHLGDGRRPVGKRRGTNSETITVPGTHASSVSQRTQTAPVTPASRMAEVPHTHR